MKMTTLEADVKKDSTNGVKYDESVKKEVEVQIHGASNPTETHKPATLEVEAENGTTNQPEKITNGETTLMAKPNASDGEVNANATVITNVKQGINAPAPLSEPDADNDVGVQIHGPSKATETWKHATVEAMVEKVENGTTNHPEKITNGETSLETKSNVSGGMELATSDPNEMIKIEREERGSSKINKQSIYAKEDPEAGTEAGKQRVREVFHMDVAELIIERDA